MATILQQIGTPLQFAALFLLLSAGLARLLIQGRKSEATARLVINRMFQLAILVLIVGLLGSSLGPALERWLSEDKTYHGTVLSASGDPVAGATVSFVGIKSAQSNPQGQYDITIPRRSTASEYKIEVKAQGFEPNALLMRPAAQSEQLEVRLNPLPVNLIKALAPEMIVAHFYGLPAIVVTLRVENDGLSLLPMTVTQATLSQESDFFVLSPVAWTLMNPFSAQYAPVTGPFPIYAKAVLDLRVILAVPANLNLLFSNIALLPDYKSSAPCAPVGAAGPNPLSLDGYALVKAFVDSHFAWKPGVWRLKMDVAAADSQSKSFARDITLTPSDIQRLRASATLMRQCLGVNLGAPLAQDAGLANFVTKRAVDAVQQ